MADRHREGTVKIRRVGIHKNNTVEVCGGVSRGPLICNAICYACGKDEGYATSRTSDDSSLSFGASLVGAIDVTMDDDNNDGNDHALRRSRLCEAKRFMHNREAPMMQRADAQRNLGPDPRMGHVTCHHCEIIFS